MVQTHPSVETMCMGAGNATNMTPTESRANSEDSDCPPIRSRVQEKQAPLSCNAEPGICIWFSGSGHAWMATKAHPKPQKVRLLDVLNANLCDKLVNEIFDSYCSKDLPDKEPASNVARPGRNSLQNQGSTKKRRAPRPSTTPSKKRRSSVQPQVVDKTGSYGDGDEISDSDDTDEYDGVPNTVLKGVRADQTDEYYDTRFRQLKQVPCKNVATIWIKACHPKKQAAYPYNGGVKVAKSRAKHGYEGGETKPSYWPSDVGWPDRGCRHCGPHHVKKPERLTLLKHLLRQEDAFFSIDKLEESTRNIDQIYNKNFDEGAMEILAEIYKVRRHELRFQRNEIDGSSEVSVMMPEESKKSSKTREMPKTRATKSTAVKEESRSNGSSFSGYDSVQRQPSTFPAPVANMSANTTPDGDTVELTPMEMNSPADTELIDYEPLSGDEPSSVKVITRYSHSEASDSQMALKPFISEQSESRQRYGIQGDWEHPPTSTELHMLQDPLAQAYPVHGRYSFLPQEVQQPHSQEPMVFGNNNQFHSTPVARGLELDIEQHNEYFPVSPALHLQRREYSPASHRPKTRPAQRPCRDLDSMVPAADQQLVPPSRTAAPKAEFLSHTQKRVPVSYPSYSGPGPAEISPTTSLDIDLAEFHMDFSKRALVDPNLEFTPAEQVCLNRHLNINDYGSSFPAYSSAQIEQGLAPSNIEIQKLPMQPSYLPFSTSASSVNTLPAYNNMEYPMLPIMGIDGTAMPSEQKWNAFPQDARRH